LQNNKTTFLDEPASLISQQWNEDAIPLVSISCITYNHENYIRDAIEGFLIQKTTFPIEILIHDDASTDGTKEIIREYETKYPHLIKPLYEVENQWVKGRRGSVVFNFPRARGKYIALCEGDDYWTDPLKLQKQVEFLESNEDCSLCFTGSEIHKSNGEIKSYSYKFTKSIDVNEYIKTPYFIPTASLVFRRDVLNDDLHEAWMDKAFAGDFILKYKAISIGNIGFIEDKCVVYNKGNVGAWSSRKLTDKVIQKEHDDNILALNYLARKTTVSPILIELKKKHLENAKIFKEALMKKGMRGLFFLIRNYNYKMNFYIGAYIKNMLIG
jgi:glycosyltransferase involved in cell wall biosynthesis